MQIVKNKNFGFHNKRSFVLFEKWVLVNFIAELLGLGIIAFVDTIFPVHNNQNLQLVLILAGVFQGLILGFGQWLVLRRYIRNSIWWILATTIGWLLGWLVILFVRAIALFTIAVTQKEFDFVTSLLGVIWLGTAAGMLIGLAQAIVLRFCLKVKFHKVVWWMNANALIWALRFFLTFIVSSIMPNRFSLSTGLMILGMEGVMAVVCSGITAIILIYLLQANLRKRYSY